MNIYEKLLAVQTELKAPKGQFNSFGNYKYRSCEDILEGVKPLLKERKACLVISDAIEQIGDRYYIKSIVKFIDLEESKENCELVTTAYAREEENKKGMDSSQITGGASSYARKYALNGLFCIDDTKDPDDTNKHGKEEKPKSETETQPKPKPVTKITKDQVSTIMGKAAELLVQIKDITAAYKVDKIEDLTVAQFKHCMKRFENTQKKAVK